MYQTNPFDEAPAAPLTASADPAALIGARLDRLPMSRRLWTIVLLISLAGVFEFYDMFFTAYVGPGMAASGLFTRSSLAPLGALARLFGGGPATFVFATFLGLYVGALLFGPLSDRCGRRRVFAAALLWYSLATLVMAFQHSGFALNAWRLICGVGLGVQLVTIATYLSELAPRQFRGRLFALNFMLEFTAVPVVALLAWLLAPYRPLGLASWRWVMLIGASAALLVLWLLRAVPESPRWLARSGRLAQAERVTEELEATVAAETGRPLPPIGPLLPESGARSSFADIWKGPYRSRTTLLSLLNFFQSVGFYGFQAWVPSLLVSQGITITTSLMYSFVIAIANPVGPLLVYLLADRLERKHQIVLAALGVAVFGLTFATRHTALPLIGCGVLVTLCANWMGLTLHNYQSEVFPTPIRARAVGFVYSWSRLSAAFVGLAIGYLLKTHGVVAVFVMIAGAMAIVALLTGLFGPRTRGRSLEAINSNQIEPAAACPACPEASGV